MTREKYPFPQVWLSIEICEAIYKAYKEVAQKVGVEAPIPEFDTRYPNALEGVLGSVQYKSDTLNYDIKTTAAYYFVHFAKSQCFLDANKRLAVIFTNTFLRINGYRLTMPPWTLRDLAIIVAKNKSLTVEYVVEQIDDLFHLLKLNNT
ncbi:MAG: type II toxin-antitoxin system death-on-curing family toxin [Alphaproteobacteria bacterium]|nr:MAG: type II toxin-antitoxin system death-on-curing family toxin [Alphaproteobacteria bacterium]